jgi:3-hydroxybutyryl-CoA dehydratase
VTDFIWECPEVSVEKMKLLTLLLDDPNPIHLDIAAVRRAGLGERLVNQGPSNIAMVVNMLNESFPDAKLAHLEIRLVGNVYAGDAVRAGGQILGSSTADGIERTSCAIWLDVAGNGRVIEGKADLVSPAKAPTETLAHVASTPDHIRPNAATDAPTSRRFVE